MEWTVENLQQALEPARRDPFICDQMREFFALAGGEELFRYERIVPFDDRSPFPLDWTAMEIGLFDNGPMPEPSRKRSFVRTQSTQFKFSIKVWASEKLDFASKKLAWRATVPLWTADEAEPILDQLHDRHLINSDTWSDGKRLCDIGDNALFGIPRVDGKKWATGHFAVCRIESNGNQVVPSGVNFLFGQHSTISADGFASELAGGLPFQGKVIGQIRMAHGDRFAGWSSHNH